MKGVQGAQMTEGQGWLPGVSGIWTKTWMMNKHPGGGGSGRGEGPDGREKAGAKTPQVRAVWCAYQFKCFQVQVI